MSRPLGVALLLSFVATAAAAQPPESGDCSIAKRVPPDAEVYHVGSYQGTSPLEPAVELDESGHEVKKLDVLVNAPGKPIILVLSAYDPVVWNVAWTRDSKIVGVVVSGYHGQAILGVPRSIPLLLTTYENQIRKTGAAGRRCPYFYAYQVDQQYRKTNADIAAMTGKEVTRFIAAPRNSIALVGSELPRSPSDRVSSSDYSLADFAVVRNAGDVPAGARGLDELVRRGYLRPATDADINAWIEEASADLKRFDPAARVAMSRGARTYVVLKPVTLPDGLYGGHSVSFIIPKGVPMPKGPPGHNSFYRMSETRCSGLGCLHLERD